MQEANHLTEFTSRYEDDFTRAIIGHTMPTAETKRTHKRRGLDKLAARDKEPDTMFERIHEDNANGELSNEQFARMSKGYGQKESEIGKRIKVLRPEVKKETSQIYTADMFLEIVRRYTNATELTQHRVTSLIDHIDVYHA